MVVPQKLELPCDSLVPRVGMQSEVNVCGFFEDSVV